jgi:hypothetical protein
VTTRDSALPLDAHRDRGQTFERPPQRDLAAPRHSIKDLGKVIDRAILGRETRRCDVCPTVKKRLEPGARLCNLLGDGIACNERVRVERREAGDDNGQGRVSVSAAAITQ